MFLADIDECEDQSLCGQICMNTVGSYSCSCEEGYQLVRETGQCNSEEICLIALIPDAMLPLLILQISMSAME